MRRYSILLVDDEESVRLSLGRQMRKAGYDVILAESGEQAMALLGSSHDNVDIIITDLMMEGMTGIQVLEQSKQLRPDINVILLTGYGTMQTVMDAMRLGAHDYLLKPCNQGELLLRIARCAERIELENQVRQDTREIERKNSELLASVARHKELEQTLLKNMDELAESNKKLEMLSTRDGLTEIANRRFFDEYLKREWSLAVRNKLIVSLIFIDVDHFKLFNDAYGHLVGDDCLKKVAHTINESLKRPADLAARYGGEKFVVLLPGTERPGAFMLAEEIRTRVENLAIPHRSSPVSNHVTISLGVGDMTPNNDSLSSELVKIADDALYKAKNNGRNRVESVSIRAR